MALPEINSANFDSEVIKSNIPVVMDLWAPWCGPCRMVAPVFEAVANDYKGKVKFMKLNTDDNPTIAANLKIMGIPTLIFYKNGKEVDRVVGMIQKDALSKKVAAIL